MTTLYIAHAFLASDEPSRRTRCRHLLLVLSKSGVPVFGPDDEHEADPSRREPGKEQARQQQTPGAEPSRQRLFPSSANSLSF